MWQGRKWFSEADCKCGMTTCEYAFTVTIQNVKIFSKLDNDNLLELIGFNSRDLS